MNTAWPEMALGEIFAVIRNGKNVTQDKSGVGHPVTRIETISAGVVDELRVGYTSDRLDDRDPNWLDPGELLFSHINSPERVGHLALYEGRPERLVHGINLLRMRPDESRLHSRFAVYLLRSDAFRSKLRPFVNQAVNQASVSVTNLKSIVVPVPPLTEQRRIAAVLDAADALRAKRRHALANLDTLTQAIFIDVFGVSSDSSVSVVRLSDHAIAITKGTTPTSVGFDFADAGVPFVRVQDLQGGTVRAATIALCISEATNKALSRSILKPRDVLISIAGTIGKVAIIPEEAPEMNCNQAVALIRTSPALAPDYLAAWLNTQNAQQQIGGSRVTGTISNLSLTSIRNLMLPLPDQLTQQRFADRTLEVQRLIEKAERSATALDVLFESLQDRAFRGGL